MPPMAKRTTDSLNRRKRYDAELLMDGDRIVIVGMKQVNMSLLKLVRQSSLSEQLKFYDQLDDGLVQMRKAPVYQAVKKSMRYRFLMSFIGERMKQTAKLDAVIGTNQKFNIQLDLPDGGTNDELAQMLAADNKPSLKKELRTKEAEDKQIVQPLQNEAKKPFVKENNLVKWLKPQAEGTDGTG